MNKEDKMQLAKLIKDQKALRMEKKSKYDEAVKNNAPRTDQTNIIAEYDHYLEEVEYYIDSIKTPDIIEQAKKHSIPIPQRSEEKHWYKSLYGDYFLSDFGEQSLKYKIKDERRKTYMFYIGTIGGFIIALIASVTTLYNVKLMKSSQNKPIEIIVPDHQLTVTPMGTIDLPDSLQHPDLLKLKTAEQAPNDSTVGDGDKILP